MSNDIAEVKRDVGDIKKTLQDINLSNNAIRRDVDLANGSVIALKVADETILATTKASDSALSDRISILEKFQVEVRTTTNVFKWLAGFLGFTNIILIVALAANYFSMK